MFLKLKIKSKTKKKTVKSQILDRHLSIFQKQTKHSSFVPSFVVVVILLLTQKKERRRKKERKTFIHCY